MEYKHGVLTVPDGELKFVGLPTVEVEQSRYDELLHKEKHLEIILAALSKWSGYGDIDKFKEVLGIEKKEVRE